MRSDAVEVVGGQHDRNTVIVEVGEQVEHVVAGVDVHSRGRLVQEQKIGFAQQCTSDEHALLLSAGQRADVAVC